MESRRFSAKLGHCTPGGTRSRTSEEALRKCSALLAEDLTQEQVRRVHALQIECGLSSASPKPRPPYEAGTSGVNKIFLSKTCTDREARASFEGDAVSSEDFDVIIREDCDAYDADSKVLIFKFRKKLMGAALTRLALSVFGKVEKELKPSDSRSTAAGPLDLEPLKKRYPAEKYDTEKVSKNAVWFKSKRSGYVTKVSNKVMSYMGGWHFCRFGTPRGIRAAFTRKFPERWEEALPFFQRLNDCHASLVPAVHALHAAQTAKHPYLTIPNTNFSTVTINVNYESSYHFDRGDFKHGYACMSVVEMGNYDGGELVFPQYRVGVDIREGDVCVKQSHYNLHGNAPLRSQSDSKRISFIMYLKQMLEHAKNAFGSQDGGEKQNLK